jgi:hypothetical protein
VKGIYPAVYAAYRYGSLNGRDHGYIISCPRCCYSTMIPSLRNLVMCMGCTLMLIPIERLGKGAVEEGL